MDNVFDEFTYISLIVYAIMIAVEYFSSSYILKKRIYSFKDTAVNLITGLFALYLPYMVALAILSCFYKLLHSYALFSLPPIWSDLMIAHRFHAIPFLLLFLCDDLSYYIYHRASHVMRVFWCIHEVHHSSEEYNFSVYFRASFLEYVFEGVFWIPMILLGFSLEDMVFQMSVSLFYQFWLHTKFTKRIPLVDLIFNVPRFHRVHHAKNIRYLDRNFGAILIIWDRLFGTFHEEDVEPVFGVLSPPNSFNVLKVNFHAFQALWKDVRNCKDGVLSRFAYLISPPGWNPYGEGQTSHELQARELSQI